MANELYYTDEFRRDAKRLEGPMQARLKTAIAKILENPGRFKHLENTNRFRVRFGVYRILYKVEGSKVILVRLGKRDEVYRS
ncbi:MAG: type II toxin-antitoxin system RelE/ParE family toxin [Candidatus Micrarchaeota archaeon]